MKTIVKWMNKISSIQTQPRKSMNAQNPNPSAIQEEIEQSLKNFKENTILFQNFLADSSEVKEFLRHSNLPQALRFAFLFRYPLPGLNKKAFSKTSKHQTRFLTI